MPEPVETEPGPPLVLRRGDGRGFPVVDRPHHLDVFPARPNLPAGRVSFFLFLFSLFNLLILILDGDLLLSLKDFQINKLSLFIFSWIYYLLCRLRDFVYWVYDLAREWQETHNNDEDDESEEGDQRAQVIISEVVIF